MDCSLKFGCMNKKLLVIVNHHDTVNPAEWFRISFVWDKLSNSGNALELQVPSYARKGISGWTNHSCMVTSLKASERNVGNRGSKSVGEFLCPTSQMSPAVKEQRVDGSYIGNLKAGYPMLRCTLMGSERNYQVKVLSNRNIKYREFSSTANNTDKSCLSAKSQIIDPWFFTGFTDAEGSFSVTIRRNSRNNTWWVEHRFSIGLNKRDLTLLKDIQNFLGGIGSIVVDDRKNSVEFRVSSLDELLTVIIPHFDKYGLISRKYGDFLLFKKIVLMKAQKLHLTSEGLQEIVNLRATLNLGLSSALKAAFPNSNPVPRPELKNISIPHPFWVAGFTSGEGSFLIDISKSSAYKLGSNVKLTFHLPQDIKDEQLLKSLVDYLDCGNYLVKRGTVGNFIVTKFSDNLEKIIPLFEAYPVLGEKAKDFEAWVKVAEIIKTKAHLTREGLDAILKIKTEMEESRR